ncbi:MAG: penicillin-binding protein 2 [Chloroflexota bacterium]|nr:penicillin-binding protein 2 [Chloroflexota bacterium]
MQRAYNQQEVVRRRTPFVVTILVIISAGLMLRLASFQFSLPLEVQSYLESLRDAGYTRTLELAADRGVIYDRNGEPLAVNTLDYMIGISPNLVSEPQRTAQLLASALGLNELEVFEKVRSDDPWVQLAPRISAAVRQQVTALDLPGVTLTPIPRRSYPQGPLAAQIIGFVGGDLVGYYGVEGYYQDQLAGQVREREISRIPFDLPETTQIGHGSDVVLTIDRDVQYLAENELLRAVQESGATGGTIIVMNPRNGEVLALANYPNFDPNAYFNITDENVLRNPAVNTIYEPGSVMKVITVAAALDRQAIAPDFSYVDSGVLNVAGISVYNWDRRAYGAVDVTRVLVDSLNIGAATVALEMGRQPFYEEFNEFGFGRITGVDLEGEEAGLMPVPGDSNWSEANYVTSSFGQGISVTPLQMLTAVCAIANDGLMMQPHVVRQFVSNGEVIPATPAALGRPISAETAQQVTQMMVAVVESGLDNPARLPGYTIAGKTGTAEIPDPSGGFYQSGVSITTFVGFLPADDPQVAILIKLDRPREYWASQVVAPVFSRFVERLVILMEIPTDDVRRQLGALGGSVNNINR